VKISEINSEIIKQYKINEKLNSGSKERINENVVLEEKVSLSSISRDIKLAKKAIEKLPDIREKKLRGLKDQIEQGTYDVSGEKIAEKMLSEPFFIS
jgi:negative regulator of flagellin synthesis FlgM